MHVHTLVQFNWLHNSVLPKNKIQGIIEEHDLGGAYGHITAINIKWIIPAPTLKEILYRRFVLPIFLVYAGEKSPYRDSYIYLYLYSPHCMITGPT